MRVPFTKMHGLGNDFVVLDARRMRCRRSTARSRAPSPTAILAIGCDQLILLEPARYGADFRMRIFNADGGEVEACGNASRAVGLLLGGSARIETRGGLICGACRATPGSRSTWARPASTGIAIPLAYAMDTRDMPVGWEALERPSAVNVGNPHVVFFVPDCDAVDLARLGPTIEHDPLFPERINVNVATIAARDRIRLRVWERGAGLTRACGTGACATAVAAMRRGLVDRHVTVGLPGGALTIAWRADDAITMTGPAAISFRGEFDTTISRPMTAARRSEPRLERRMISLGCRLNLAESEACAGCSPPSDDLVM